MGNYWTITFEGRNRKGEYRTFTVVADSSEDAETRFYASWPESRYHAVATCPAVAGLSIVVDLTKHE